MIFEPTSLVEGKTWSECLYKATQESARHVDGEVIEAFFYGAFTTNDRSIFLHDNPINDF